MVYKDLMIRNPLLEARKKHQVRYRNSMDNKCTKMNLSYNMKNNEIYKIQLNHSVIILYTPIVRV